MYYSIKHKKTIAKLICLLFIAALILSMTYIVKEANHECLGANCPICAHIQMAERTIGELGTAFAISLHIISALVVFCAAIFQLISQTVLLTPITRNVRMNN